MTVFFIQECEHGPIRFSQSSQTSGAERVVFEVPGGSGVLQEMERRLAWLQMRDRPGWYFTNAKLELAVERKPGEALKQARKKLEQAASPQQSLFQEAS